MKPTLGSTGRPFIGPSGKPQVSDGGCSCCDTINGCEDALHCLKKRRALLKLSLEESNNDPETCLVFPYADLNTQILYRLNGLICTGGGVNNDGTGGACGCFPIAFYPWRGPNSTPVAAALQPIVEDDPNLCSLTICNSAIGAFCDGDYVYITWDIAWFNCGCDCPDCFGAPFYYPCESGCACSNQFARLLISDPIHWTDLKTMLLQAVVEIDLHISPDQAGSSCPFIGSSSTAIVKFFGKPPCGGACVTTPPEIVSFELVPQGGCRYEITYELAPGQIDCPLAIAYIELPADEEDDELGSIIEVPVEPIGAEWPNTISVLLTSKCGEHGGVGNPGRLVVWDECGCSTTATADFFCCLCEDGITGASCGGCFCDEIPSGSISVEQLGPCTHRLCGTIDLGACPTGFIEYRLLNSGSCNETELGGCPCIGDPEIEYSPTCLECSGVLTNGCTDIEIDRPTFMIYRTWDGVCGCATEWSEPIELPCEICECCDGLFGGAMMTVSGAADCPNRHPAVDCNCADVNGTYNVPYIADCQGELTVEEAVTCITNLGGGFFDTSYSSITLNWIIDCDEAGYWLRLGFSTSGTAAEFGMENSLFLGEEKPICAEITGCVDIDSDVVADSCCCDWYSLITLCAEFYS